MALFDSNYFIVDSCESRNPDENVGRGVLTTPFCLGRRLVGIVEIASSYLLAMTKG